SHNVREHKPVARDDLAGGDGNRAREHRARAAEAVELASLAARVHVLRQVSQERRVVSPAGKTRIELPGIDTRQYRVESTGQHRLCQRIRRQTPEREDRIQTGARKTLLAI